jgi:hypothetical protein
MLTQLVFHCLFAVSSLSYPLPIHPFLFSFFLSFAPSLSPLSLSLSLSLYLSSLSLSLSLCVCVSLSPLSPLSPLALLSLSLSLSPLSLSLCIIHKASHGTATSKVLRTCSPTSAQLVHLLPATATTAATDTQFVWILVKQKIKMGMDVRRKYKPKWSQTALCCVFDLFGLNCLATTGNAALPSCGVAVLTASGVVKCVLPSAAARCLCCLLLLPSAAVFYCYLLLLSTTIVGPFIVDPKTSTDWQPEAIF